MLSEELKKCTIKFLHADDDTDLLIVQTAVYMAICETTYVIAEDTAILILLLYLLPLPVQ